MVGDVDVAKFEKQILFLGSWVTPKCNVVLAHYILRISEILDL